MNSPHFSSPSYVNNKMIMDERMEYSDEKDQLEINNMQGNIFLSKGSDALNRSETVNLDNLKNVSLQTSNPQ